MEFIKGQEVEVTSNEQGFEDSWFVATITRRLKNKKFLVEYQSLVDETESYIPLRETVDVSQLRPLPPKETAITTGSFQLNEEVDAFLNDGWWKGVISKILVMGSRYSVFFRPTKEEKEFNHSDLRTHLDWIDGKWVTPPPNQVTTAPVEVRLDDEACHGAWFPATILENISNSSVLVGYKRLHFGEKAEHLREVVDSARVRPSPPQSSDGKFFDVLEKVDAFYDFGWWSGVITKVLANKKYIVFFKHQNKQKEFNGSDLRLHMDWIDDKWFLDSRETVVIGQDDASVQSSNPTDNSALRTDMATPQTPSGVSDIPQEIELQGLGGVDSLTEVLKKKRGRPGGSGKIGQNEASVQSPNTTDNSALRTDMTTLQAPSGVSDIAQEIQLQGLGGVDDQTEKVLKKKRGRPGGSSKIEQNEASVQSPNPTDNSALRTDMSTPQTPNGVSDIAQEIQLQGLGGVDDQTDKVLKKKRGRPAGSGKKRKSGSTKSLDTTFQSKGLENESAITEMTDGQTECTPSSTHLAAHQPHSMFLEKSQFHMVEDIGGPDNESSIKEMTDVQTEYTPSSSHVADEDRPLSMFFKKSKSHTAKDTGGVVDKQIVDILKRKSGGPKGSSKTTLVKGLEKEFASKETTGVLIECSSLSSHIAEEHQPPSTLFESSNSYMVTSNGGPELEDTSEELKVVQTEAPQLLSHTAELIQPIYLGLEKSNSPEVKDNRGVSHDNQLMPNGITLIDTSMESIVFPESSNVVDQASGDDGDLHSVDITLNTYSSPPQQDEGPLRTQDESLPFIKSSHLWGAFESMEVFQLIPQQPHFRPLEKYDEELREGYAVGNMLNFANLVEKTGKAKFDEPSSVFEKKLKAITDLEELGFTVEPIRLRLEKLLRIKVSYSQLEDTSKTTEREMIEEKRKFDEVKEAINQLNLKLQKLLMEKEMKGSNIAELQRTVDATKERIHRARLDFDSMVGSPLVSDHPL